MAHMHTASRTRVKVECCRGGGSEWQRRTVFASKMSVGSRNGVSVREVQECMDAAAGLRDGDRAAYFASNGIDYENAVRYHRVVAGLEGGEPPRTPFRGMSDGYCAEDILFLIMSVIRGIVGR